MFVSPAFEELFVRHGAASFDKELYRQAMLGKCGWAFDLNSGVLAFRRPHEGNLQLRVQVLGSESEESRTWLWAWANPSAIPAELLTVARELRAAYADVPELSTPELPMSDQVNAQHIVMVACGIARAGCAFRAAYPRGSLYLLVKDPHYKRSVRRPIARILRVFPAFIARYAVADQRAALMHYLRFYRLDVREEGRRVIGTHNAAAHAPLGVAEPLQVVAEFDEAGQLTQMV
jgi:hypothetical protein